MVPLETLQNPSFGFLVNNTIAIGLELIQLKRLACNGIERSSFIQKKTLSGSHSWYIDDFFQLKKPSVFSEPFQVGGYTWYVMKPHSPSYVGMYRFYCNDYPINYQTFFGTFLLFALLFIYFLFSFHSCKRNWDIFWYCTSESPIGIIPKSFSSPLPPSSCSNILNLNIRRLKLQPKGVGNKNYLSLYLKLDRSRSQLPPSEGVMVDLVLSIKKQPTGTYKGRGWCLST